MRSTAIGKVFKYEFSNVLRGRWIIASFCFWLALSFFFRYLSEDVGRALLSIGTISVVLVPLLSILFSSVYCYYSDRFTELLLTLPLPRLAIYNARWIALFVPLSLSTMVAVALPFVIFGNIHWNLVFLLGQICFLSLVFVLIGVWISSRVVDRMRGLGFVLGVWFYFSILHDGIILLGLLGLRDYPLDIPAGIFGILNPLGLCRVVLLMMLDAPMLLGYSGALARKVLTTPSGIVVVVVTAFLWSVIPWFMGQRTFQKRNF